MANVIRQNYIIQLLWKVFRIRSRGRLVKE